MNEAGQNGSLGDPSEWDGRTVRRLLEEAPIGLGDGSVARIAATHLVHPPTFGKQQREFREKYAVDHDPYTRRPRHGFYVYRNDRVIALAERFYGIVGNQVSNWAFRARLMFDESADDVLSLDVKKRHCQLPRQVRNHLKAMISTRVTWSADAWKAAGKRERNQRRSSKDEIANESIAKTPVSSLDYSPGADLQDDASIAEKNKRQKDISAETVSAIQDSKASSELLDELAEKRNVVASVEGLKANAMWLPYPSVRLGKAETVVNKAHSWVAEAYSAAEIEPRITVVLHQLFTILARAELEVRSIPYQDLNQDQTDRIFDRFRKKASAFGEELAEDLAKALTDISDADDDDA